MQHRLFRSGVPYCLIAEEITFNLTVSLSFLNLQVHVWQKKAKYNLINVSFLGHIEYGIEFIVILIPNP